jgi:signal transduction histidine kinase
VAERIVVHDAVREALWSVAPDYSSHLQVHVDPRLAIETDRGAFNTILVNLISNAVRYGRPPIVISAELAGEFSLTIHDEGRGVSRDFQPRLFEPFSRSSESEHSSSGLGLGLAIAAMSAEENSGSLTYEGQGPGACFRLVLPQSPRIGDPPQIRRMPARSPQPSTNVRLLSAAV